MLLAWRHRLEFLAFQFVVCLIDCLSPRMAARMATNLAGLVHYGLPRKLTRFKVARDNIRTAFGEQYTDAEIDRVMSPIGLDIGARTPEETAVAICAEIIGLRTGRRAQSLRDTAGPIH